MSFVIEKRTSTPGMKKKWRWIKVEGQFDTKKEARSRVAEMRYEEIKGEFRVIPTSSMSNESAKGQ